MKKTSKITLILGMILVVILGLTIISNADDGTITQIDASSIGISGNTTSGGSTDNATPNGTAGTKNTGNNTNNSNSGNNTNSGRNITKANVNQNLPSTGLEDYTPLFIIVGALVVTAVVAYKKARLYKGI